MPRRSHRRVAVLLLLGVAASALSATAANAVPAPLAPMAIDLSFGGGDGVATVDLGGFDGCAPGFDATQSTRCGIAVQPDGRIVTAATSVGASQNLLVARFGVDGAPDPTFGVGGAVVIDLGDDEKAYDVAVDSAGRIVVVGQTISGGPSRPLVVRLLPDGTLDPAFGNGGVTVVEVQTSSVGFARSVVIGPGDTVTLSGALEVASDLWFMVARLTADGALDPSFNAGGIFTGIRYGGNVAEAIALRSDGTVVAAGSTFIGVASALTFQLHPSGVPDAGWGICGYRSRTVQDATGGGAYGIDLDPNGRATVVGFSAVAGGARLFATRFLPDSTFDATFGDGGIVDLQIDAVLGLAVAVDVTRGPDGVLYVAGRYMDGPRFYGFVLALTADGVPDETFGPGGLVILDAAAIDPTDITLGSDGHVLVVGTTTGGSTADLGVVRLARRTAVAPAYTC